MRHALALGLAVLLASPAFAETPAIRPGEAVGPVRLGMTAVQGRTAAEAFRQETGCRIDLDILDGHVASAGSRYGGCLSVALPASRPLQTSTGLRALALPTGIGGVPEPLTAAFGQPLTVRIANHIGALVWSNGLVARIVLDSPIGIITYLAVIPAGSSEVPYALLTAPDPDLEADVPPAGASQARIGRDW